MHLQCHADADVMLVMKFYLEEWRESRSIQTYWRYSSMRLKQKCSFLLIKQESEMDKDVWTMTLDSLAGHFTCSKNLRLKGIVNSTIFSQIYTLMIKMVFVHFTLFNRWFNYTSYLNYFIKDVLDISVSAPSLSSIRNKKENDKLRGTN